MSAHSIIPASSAARRMQCPASRRLEALAPVRENNAYAEEGTAAHAEAAELLRSGRAVGEVKHAGVDEYVEYVRSIKHDIMFVELQIESPYVHDESGGTPDVVLLNSTEKKCHVVDFKYGFNPVQATENWQLLTYAASYFSDSVDVYCLHIFQPRSRTGQKSDVWVLTRNELLGYIIRLRDSESLAMTPDAPARTGPECHYCSARGLCPALKQAAGDVSESVRLGVQELDDAQAALELAYLEESEKLLSARKIALSEQVTRALSAGSELPCYRLERGRGAKRWALNPRDVVLLGDLYRVDVRKHDTLTPTQAVKAGIPESVVAANTVITAGSMSLKKIRR